MKKLPMRRPTSLAALGSACVLALAPVTAQKTTVTPPILIAHRGASGERPEHTLASYDLAIDEGADYIEPDLVPTKDDVLVARHENDITGTTDVTDHPEFAARRTTRTIDGEAHTGWFVEDFTLAELRTLRARERLPELRPANTRFDGRFTIPTLADIIELAKRRSRETGRTIGIYPETKHPTYFASIGHPTDRLLVDQLHAAGWDNAVAPVFIQSFEVRNLRHLATITRVRLIQLLDATGGPADGAAGSYAAMATPAGLAAIARYAWGIGPNKTMVEGTPLIADAHAAGLRVHPWTFRAENRFLPAVHRRGADPAAHGDYEGELGQVLRAGADGFFTDFPALGFAARQRAAKR